MKKLILSLAIIAFMAGTISISYGQEAHKKSEKAREDLKGSKQDVVDARQNLKDAQADSISQYKAFKKESELKIRNNEDRIEELKSRTPETTEKDRAAYHKNLSKLEQKNADLKQELAEYNGESDWALFKTKFSSDLDGLGKSITDFVK